MSPASIISMPTVKTIPVPTAVTIGFRHWFARPKGSILPSGRGLLVAVGRKNFGISPGLPVKLSPLAQRTPTQRSLSLSSKGVGIRQLRHHLRAEDIFAGLSMTIFRILVVALEIGATFGAVALALISLSFWQELLSRNGAWRVVCMIVADPEGSGRLYPNCSESSTEQPCPLGSSPDFLLGGRTSASAECRHWSGRAVRWSKLRNFG